MMNDIDSWVKLAIQIIIPIGGLIYGYARLNASVERSTERIDKVEKFVSEHFDRIEVLERKQSVQEEINRNMGDHWKRIEDKLNTIEGLLRQRRIGDS